MPHDFERFEGFSYNYRAEQRKKRQEITEAARKQQQRDSERAYYCDPEDDRISL